MPGSGNLTWTLSPRPRLTVRWGMHKGEDSAGLPPKRTLRQGMKTVHLEDGAGETIVGEGRSASRKGRHRRSSTWSSTWRPTPLETSGRKARGACLRESSQLRDRRAGAPTHWSRAAPGAPAPEPPTGLGRGSTHLSTSVQTKNYSGKTSRDHSQVGLCVGSAHTDPQPPQREANSRDKTRAKSKMKCRLRNFQASGRPLREKVQDFRGETENLTKMRRQA